MYGRQQTEEFVSTFQEIQKLLNSRESKTVINEIQNKDIVMCIGNTKSGKSTLVNYAIGNQLKAVRKNVFPFSFSIAKVNYNDPGPVIGLESISETTLPTVWSSRNSGLNEKVVDAPGFEDNRGEVHDIANSFYIREIIRNAKSIKFILISDIGDIMSDNIGPFINIIEKINNIFPDPDILEGGIILVLSKGPDNVQSHHISEKLTSDILKQERIKMSNKSLIRYFARNHGAITFFYQPNKEGNINEQNIGQGVMDAKNQINGIPCNKLCNVKPGISDKSRVLLLQLQTKFCNIGEYQSILERIHTTFGENYCESVHDTDHEFALNTLDNKLEIHEKNLEKLLHSWTAELNIHQLLPATVQLGNICGISNITDHENIDLKLQFVEFLDDTLHLNNCAIFRERFLGTLSMIKSDLNKARLRVQSKLITIFLERAEREKMELEQKHIEEMKLEIAAAEEENRRREQQRAQRRDSDSDCCIL